MVTNGGGGTDTTRDLLIRGVLRLLNSWILAVVVLTTALLAAFASMHRQGVDAQWPYLYAYGVWGGHPIFSEAWREANLPGLTGYISSFGLFWPAAMGIVMLPFALVSLSSVKILLLVVSIVALGAAICALFSLAQPQVKWPTRLTIVGLVLLTACARWGWTLMQVAPLLAALLVATLVGVRRDRPWLAYVGMTLVLAIKPTLGLPFVLLLLLHRRYRIIVLAVATNVLFNVIGFMRMGGLDAVSAYRAGMSTLEQTGGINTPNFWEHGSMARVDWTYLVTGLSGSFTLGRLVAIGVGGALALFLVVTCVRATSPPSLADTCRIMLAGTCVGLITVYHHYYDLAVLIPPLLLVALLWRELELSWSRWIAWSFVPITLLMAFVPAVRGPTIVASYIGDGGYALVHVLFPVAMTGALFGSLAMALESSGTLVLRRHWLVAVRQRGTAKATSEIG